MKVAELRAALEERELDSTGRKAQLVARLSEALGAAGTEEQLPPGKKRSDRAGTAAEPGQAAAGAPPAPSRTSKRARQQAASPAH